MDRRDRYKGFDGMKDIKYRVLSLAGGLALLVSAVSFLMLPHDRTIALGVIFGAVIAGLMFWQTERTIRTAVSLSPEAAQRYMMSRYALRMIVYLAVIFASIRSEDVHILGTLAGLLTIKAAVLILAIFTKDGSTPNE
ncbi:MAG: ATP synthase subunit I [Peptostreptococcaceae bacterium]|nr:ATP synthase subunit I [Peptostreptococcaceae bacterium]